MGIVTISASYGAGGAEVAPAVAERLGLPFHDRGIPAQVAGRLRVPVAEAEANDESVVRGLWRLVASLGTMPDPVGGMHPAAAAPDERAYRQQTEKVLTEMADGQGWPPEPLGREEIEGAFAGVHRVHQDRGGVAADGAHPRPVAVGLAAFPLAALSISSRATAGERRSGRPMLP